MSTYANLMWQKNSIKLGVVTFRNGDHLFSKKNVLQKFSWKKFKPIPTLTKGHFVVAISRPRKTPSDRNVVIAGTILEDDKRKMSLHLRTYVGLIRLIRYGVIFNPLATQITKKLI